MLETNMSEILTHIEAQNKIEKQEVCVLLYCVILCYIVLCYIMSLYYSIIYYFVLYSVVFYLSSITHDRKMR